MENGPHAPIKITFLLQKRKRPGVECNKMDLQLTLFALNERLFKIIYVVRHLKKAKYIFY